eukprot:TRINITY_DN6560_c0_g1_i1.p1 TRINITY_DN6560_c0_g1~~TRINITY_DN6560_c0_g1_i1.p1  ORF type:complete len:418 (+),score=71.86 TRINITY_DN6560_c0_g1_i1:104-1357(+)
MADCRREGSPPVVLRSRRATVAGGYHRAENFAQDLPRTASVGKLRPKVAAANNPAKTARELVTKRPAVWHTAPCAESPRIQLLPTGKRVTEVISTRSFPGWVAVAPRGFLREEDVTLAEEGAWLMESRLPTPRPLHVSTDSFPKNGADSGEHLVARPASARASDPVRPRRGSLRAPSGRADVARPVGGGRLVSAALGAALEPGKREERARGTEKASSVISLREEQVRLRETNVGLKEEGLQVKIMLDGARQERETIQRELEELKAARAQEQADLDRYRSQRGQLREKLTRAREVVYRTIGHVDTFYRTVAECEEVAAAEQQVAQSAEEAGSILAELEENASLDKVDGDPSGRSSASSDLGSSVSKENKLPSHDTDGDLRSAKLHDSSIHGKASPRLTDREALRSISAEAHNTDSADP